jgi:hypothetical protein
MIHSGNATRNRKEERLLRERLQAMELKADVLVKEVGATAPAFPTEVDIEEVGKLLVEGHIRLPKYARVNVTTEIEERKDPIFGTSTIYHHTCDQLCCHQLQPMSIPAALEAGLIVRLGSNYLWCESAYRRLVPPDPRLIPLAGTSSVLR